jgi:hypothetical protein
MPTVVNFKGKKVIEPGVYAQIKSGIPAKSNNFSFGNLAIIDTGKGKQWGGGSGINGKFANGINSFYSFSDVDDFKSFVKGGLFYDLADYIFNPLNGASGPETVQLIRACNTTPAEIIYNFTSGSNGGTVKFLCKNEGEIGNGFTNETLGSVTMRFEATSIMGGNEIEIQADGVVIGTYVCTSNSMSEALNGISNAINSGTSGYTAKIQGSSVLLYTRPNSGDTNGIVIEATSDVGFQNGPLEVGGWNEGTMLTKGYAAEMKVSDLDNTKYIISFFEGTHAGYTDGGESINGLTEEQSLPILITESVEFNNIDDLIQWAKNDFIFNKVFELDENYNQIGTGTLDSADFGNNQGLRLAINGVSNYTAAALDKTLTDIRELQNTFFLSDRFGDEARSIENMKILNAIKNNSEFDKFLIIGGGADETKFDTGANSSIEIAKFFDTTSVIVVHSGETRYNQYTGKKEKLPSIYHAANFAGRLGGLEPQVPATFKALKIKEFNHPLGLKQREKALKHGVIHNRTVPGIGNVTNQAVNSLQNNSHLINQDGTSPEISIMRIGAQLNKELILNMRPLFVGNNWGQASPADVKTYIEGYLLGRTVTSNQDNLILSFKNVTVRLIEDYYDIKYGFVPNGPINKLFVTGFMLDANLSA